MAPITLEKIHEDLTHLQKDIKLIKNVIAEEFELSDKTKKDLEKARKTPEKEYIDHKEVEKEFLK